MGNRNRQIAVLDHEIWWAFDRTSRTQQGHQGDIVPWTSDEVRSNMLIALKETMAEHLKGRGIKGTKQKRLYKTFHNSIARGQIREAAMSAIRLGVAPDTLHNIALLLG